MLPQRQREMSCQCGKRQISEDKIDEQELKNTDIMQVMKKLITEGYSRADVEQLLGNESKEERMGRNIERRKQSKVDEGSENQQLL